MEANTNTNTPANPGSGTNDGNGNDYGKPGNDKKNFIDGDGNEITRSGKFLAGGLLIVITFCSILYLIGHWPDRLVAPRDHMKPLYIYKWFHVRLAEIPDTGRVRYVNDSTAFAEEPGFVNTGNKKPDTIQIPDTLKDVRKIDSIRKVNNAIIAGFSTKPSPQLSAKIFPAESELLHINTLLLILVGVAGFLGNMIHIASSFTTFIGNGDFKKRWSLWYIVKPLTAAAMAIAIYFVFRGGFLNMSDDSTNINLYGLMTISILAGLFTDRTTLKLKEIFDVLLRPKEERANPLVKGKPQVISIDAQPLELGKAVTIAILGKNLDSQPITIKLQGQEVMNVNKQPSVISFNYTLPPELKDKETLLLEISDDTGKEIHPAKVLTIKKDSNTQTGPIDA
jgi:hypothetical protein